MVVNETDLELRDGRELHVYDTGDPPEPLFPTAGEHGIRLVGYDRPGYGGSKARRGRDVSSPGVLYLHGVKDRMVPSSHSQWLARHTPTAELWLRPDDGHVSVLSSAPAAMRWLREHARA